MNTKFKVVSSHLDAAESIFFQRQLEHILTAAVDVEYPELKARSVIPVNTETRPGNKSITYRQYDKVGVAKIIANYADDLPRVDLLGEEVTVKVHVIADSFGYSVFDIQSSQITGMSLDQKLADAAREAALRTENKAAFLGDSKYNMVGLLNHPNMVLFTVQADGTGASKRFNTKTADQLIRDVQGLIDATGEATNDIENPNTVAFSPRAYNVLKGKRVGVEGSTVTVLKFLQDNNPGVSFIKLNELKNLGDSGTTDRMVAFNRNPRKFEMHLVQDFTMLNPQERNLELVVPCFQQFGGTTVYKPFSISYADGVMAD